MPPGIIQAAGRATGGRSTPVAASALRLADLEACEARDGHRLADGPGDGLDGLRHLDLRVADRRLVEQDDLLVEGAELALDDLVDHLGRLARRGQLGAVDVLLLLDG